MKDELKPKLETAIEAYKQVSDFNQLLLIDFTTIFDYLWLLRISCEFLSGFGKRAVLYLAAAVSDFYLPLNEIVSYNHLSDLKKICKT